MPIPVGHPIRWNAALIHLAFFGWLAMLAVESASAQELGWKWNVGDQFEVVAEQVQSSRTTVDARQTDLESNVTSYFQWTVLSVGEDGRATIEQTMTRLKVLVENPAVPSQTVQYDTGSDAKTSGTSARLKRQVEPILDLPIQFVMLPAGRIDAVTLPAATREAIDDLPNAMELKTLLGSDGLEQTLGSGSVEFPRPPSDTWTVNRPIDSAFGQINREQTYRLDGTETQGEVSMQRISMTARIPELEAAAKAGTEDPASAQEEVRLLSFSGSGSLLFDLDAGLLRRSEATYEMETERTYREKTIVTRMENGLILTIRPKP